MNDSQSPSPPSTGPALQPHRGKFNFWRWFWIGTLVVSLGWAYYDFYVPPNNVAWADNYTSRLNIKRLDPASPSSSSSPASGAFPVGS